MGRSLGRGGGQLLVEVTQGEEEDGERASLLYEEASAGIVEDEEADKRTMKG